MPALVFKTSCAPLHSTFQRWRRVRESNPVSPLSRRAAVQLLTRRKPAPDSNREDHALEGRMSSIDSRPKMEALPGVEPGSER